MFYTLAFGISGLGLSGSITSTNVVITIDATQSRGILYKPQ